MNPFRAIAVIASAAFTGSRCGYRFGSRLGVVRDLNGDRRRNESHSQLNQSWVLGLSRRTLYRPASLDGSPRPMDLRAMMVWIDNYCDANPLKDIFDAAQALIDDMEGRGPTGYCASRRAFSPSAPGKHEWRNPATVSSSTSACVTGGSARWPQLTRSHSRQLTP